MENIKAQLPAYLSVVKLCKKTQTNEDAFISSGGRTLQAAAVSHCAGIE